MSVNSNNYDIYYSIFYITVGFPKLFANNQFVKYIKKSLSKISRYGKSLLTYHMLKHSLQNCLFLSYTQGVLIPILPLIINIFAEVWFN